MMTLFVDASLDPKTGAAGYGAWAKCDLWMSGKQFGGPIRIKCRTSSEAEICGIANALSQVAEFVKANKTPFMNLQCDNIRALGALACNIDNVRMAKRRGGVTIAMVQRHKLTDIEKAAVDHVRGLKLPTIWVRHVRGHSPKEDGRHGVNNLCDMLAKSYMRTSRQVGVAA